MSAPLTPQEMADWLEAMGELVEHRAPVAKHYREIAAWVRQQPTDAQKIEALKLAADASAWGMYVGRKWRGGYMPDGYAVRAWTMACKALRLLGLLPTEDNAQTQS